MVREAGREDLPALLNLYLSLHETAVPEDSVFLRQVWEAILRDENRHLLVYERDGELVSSCDCVIIPNLTRGVRPYALIENVVTRTDCRGKGFASQCLARAGALAAAAGCYKVMLMTGSRQESTLRFYRKAGFDSEEKTAFVLRLDRREAFYEHSCAADCRKPLCKYAAEREQTVNLSENNCNTGSNVLQ